MKKFIKTSVIISLALLAFVAGIVWLGSRSEQPDESFDDNILDTSKNSSFEVRVVVPRLSRPFAGVLPDWLVRKFDLTPGEMRFDHTSSGAQIMRAAPDRVELKTDDWNFFIETDAEGRVTPATRLVFPLALGGRHVRLNCRPADRGNGYLRTKTRAGSNELIGRFLVQLATCKNADSGKDIEWPGSPLTVSGRFVGQPRQPSVVGPSTGAKEH